MLVLGVSWWCCGLLKLKFHSEVGFVCFFGNYSHHRNCVSEGKGLAGVYQCVLCSALALSFAVPISPLLTCKPSPSAVFPEERRQAARRGTEWGNSEVVFAQWSGSDFLSSGLNLGITRAEPPGLGYLPLPSSDFPGRG